MAGLCSAQRKLPPAHNSSGKTGTQIYSLQRTLDMRSASDAVVDPAPASAMGGGGGPGCGSAGVVVTWVRFCVCFFVFFMLRVESFITCVLYRRFMLVV